MQTGSLLHVGHFLFCDDRSIIIKFKKEIYTFIHSKIRICGPLERSEGKGRSRQSPAQENPTWAEGRCHLLTADVAS